MKINGIFPVFFIGLSSMTHANELSSTQERTAFALLDSVMSIVSARIDSSSCLDLRGTYSLSLFATGIGGQRRQNNLVTVSLPDHPVAINGYPRSKILGIGTQIQTGYTRTSNYTDFDPVGRYVGMYRFNLTDELVKIAASLELRNELYETQAYDTEAVTSFYLWSPDNGDSETRYNWGMSWLSTSEYPKSKYLQRVNSSRDEGEDTVARTLFVRDTLAKDSCRIKIDISGHNNSDFFSQEGYLSIDILKPNDPVDVFFNQTFDK